MVLPKLVWKDFFKKLQLGPIGYAVVTVFVLTMLFVPVKIILRNFFAIKYIVSFPGFNLNI